MCAAAVCSAAPVLRLCRVLTTYPAALPHCRGAGNWWEDPVLEKVGAVAAAQARQLVPAPQAAATHALCPATPQRGSTGAHCCACVVICLGAVVWLAVWPDPQVAAAH